MWTDFEISKFWEKSSACEFGVSLTSKLWGFVEHFIELNCKSYASLKSLFGIFHLGIIIFNDWGEWESWNCLACRREVLWRDLFNGCKNLKGGCKRDATRLRPAVPSDRIEAVGTNLNTGGSLWTFFHCGVTEHCQRLPQKFVQSPFLETFVISSFLSSLDTLLGNML